MTVARLRHKLHSVTEHEGDDAEGIRLIIDVLGRFGDMSLAAFAGLLDKIKIPKSKPAPKRKKTDEELEGERRAKEEAAKLKQEQAAANKATKAAAAAEQKRIDAANKAVEAARIAQEKAEQKTKADHFKKEVARRKKELADREKAKQAEVKAELKRIEDASKAAEKARVAQEKANQKRLEKEKSELEKKQPSPEIRDFGNELNALIERAKREQATYAEIEGYIARMQPLTKPQLLHVAEIINSEVGLASKPKAAIIKKLGDTLRRVLAIAERKKM